LQGDIRNGGRAVVADRDIAAATEAVAALGAEKPGLAEPFPLDITDGSSLDELLLFAGEKFGRIDALVNNAYPRNRNYGRGLEEVQYEDFCENVSSHLGGYFLASQRFSLFFREQGHGNIINMGSIYGSTAPRFGMYEGTGMTMPVEYAAIKAGIAHLTRYFAQYFKKHNIRVNTLSPGGILDGQEEKFLGAYRSFCGTKGMLSPEDICGSLVFLLSDDSRFLTGQEVIVDDGFSL